MTDDKRSEVISFKVTERMAVDLLHLAAADDRSMSDYLYGMVRRKLYGDVVRLEAVASQSTKHDEVNHGAR
jgi:hypothetical protein